MQREARLARGIGVSIVALFLIAGAAFGADAILNTSSSGDAAIETADDATDDATDDANDPTDDATDDATYDATVNATRNATRDATVNAMKATNHGIASRGLKKKRAPRAATSAHRLTALDAT